MSMADVLDTIQDATSEPIVSLEQPIATAGLDSLDLLALIVRLEEKSGVSVPRAQESQFETIGDVTRFFAHS